MRPVQVFKIPPLHPNMCMKCRSGDQTREFFVDLGFDTDYEGTVYLCNLCLVDIGKTANVFMTYVDHMNVVNQLDGQIRILNEINDNWNSWANVFETVLDRNLVDFLETLEAVYDEFNAGTDGTAVDADSNSIEHNPESSGDAEYTESDDLPSTSDAESTIAIPIVFS